MQLILQDACSDFTGLLSCITDEHIYIYYLSLLLQSFTQCRTCHSGHFFELNGCQESANLRTAELLRSFSEAVEVGIVMDPEPKDVR